MLLVSKEELEKGPICDSRKSARDLFAILLLPPPVAMLQRPCRRGLVPPLRGPPLRGQGREGGRPDATCSARFPSPPCSSPRAKPNPSCASVVARCRPSIPAVDRRFPERIEAESKDRRVALYLHHRRTHAGRRGTELIELIFPTTVRRSPRSSSTNSGRRGRPRPSPTTPTCSW